MQGRWVPPHFAVSMEPWKAQTLLHLLREVNADAGFPLNDGEQEVVDELVRLLEEQGGVAVPQ